MNWRPKAPKNKIKFKKFWGACRRPGSSVPLDLPPVPSDAAAHSRHATWFICECLNIGYSINFTFARLFLFMQICGKKE